MNEKLFEILIDKGAIYAFILGILYLIYKTYVFTNQRYQGKNPRRCPNCRTKTCILVDSGFVSSQGVAYESWECSKCKRHIKYVIH